MPSTNTDRVIVEGKVVEIVEKDGKPTARVSVDPFYLDVPHRASLRHISAIPW
jgi:hypothetical protein